MFSESLLVNTFIYLLSCQLQLYVGVNAMPNQAVMPESCRDKNYCTAKAANYPQETITKIMSVLKIKMEDQEIGNRWGSDKTSIICPYKSVYDLLYQIVDTNGYVRHVIQVKGSFEQKTYIRECEMPGPVLAENAADVFSDQEEIEQFNVTCVPTFTHMKYLVLSHDQRGVEMVSPKGGLPVWCSCRYDSQYSVN